MVRSLRKKFHEPMSGACCSPQRNRVAYGQRLEPTIVTGFRAVVYFPGAGLRPCPFTPRARLPFQTYIVVLAHSDCCPLEGGELVHQHPHEGVATGHAPRVGPRRGKPVGHTAAQAAKSSAAVSGQDVAPSCTSVALHAVQTGLV